MNVRMLAPEDVRYQTRTVNGRTYTGTPGHAYDIPGNDAAKLEANGWIRLGDSGATADRPSGTLGLNAAFKGRKFFDTTLGTWIFYDGSAWRDETGAAV